MRGDDTAAALTPPLSSPYTDMPKSSKANITVMMEPYSHVSSHSFSRVWVEYTMRDVGLSPE